MAEEKQGNLDIALMDRRRKSSLLDESDHSTAERIDAVIQDINGLDLQALQSGQEVTIIPDSLDILFCEKRPNPRDFVLWTLPASAVESVESEQDSKEFLITIDLGAVEDLGERMFLKVRTSAPQTLCSGIESAKERANRVRFRASTIQETRLEMNQTDLLAWGWMSKKGEGGWFHSSRIPEGHVLCYYEDRPDETVERLSEIEIIDARGLIDLQDVKQIRIHQPETGSLRGEPELGTAIDVITEHRQYVLVPESINKKGEPFEGRDDVGLTVATNKEEREAVVQDWMQMLNKSLRHAKSSHYFDVHVRDSPVSFPAESVLKLSPTEIVIKIVLNHLDQVHIPMRNVRWEQEGVIPMPYNTIIAAIETEIENSIMVSQNLDFDDISAEKRTLFITFNSLQEKNEALEYITQHLPEDLAQ